MSKKVEYTQTRLKVKAEPPPCFFGGGMTSRQYDRMTEQKQQREADVSSRAFVFRLLSGSTEKVFITRLTLSNKPEKK